MAIKFQYNKTSLGDMRKKLQMRQRALPTIKSKESALRLEVKKARDAASEVDRQLEELLARYSYMAALWSEFDGGLLRVRDVELTHSKIAGVRVPVLNRVALKVEPFSMFNSPKWYYDGIALLRGLAQTAIEREFAQAKLNLLEFSRKKTTQKVNLFEKVQIPGYEDALRKIKRFMEDEENLSKSSQKILKTLQEKRKEVAV